MTRILRGHGRVVPAEVFEASVEAERIRADARRHGFAEGWEHAMASASEVLARAHHEARRQRERSEDDLRRLAVAIAERILGAELSVRPEAVEGIVKQALVVAGRRRDLLLRVHPEDASLLGALVESRSLEVECDPRVRRGGCVLKVGRSTIDARLDTQLAVLEQALRDES